VENLSIVHRRPKFRAAPDSVDRLHKLADDGVIDLVIPFQLAGLEGEHGMLSTINLVDLDGNERSLKADVLLPFFGLTQNIGPIADWGLNLDHNHITVAQETMATDKPGIFGIGDIITYPGKLKLIVNGFAEAATAAHSARAYLHPGEELHFEYSTTKGVP
jgi:thioredoxin reductase (NADPH)